MNKKRNYFLILLLTLIFHSIAYEVSAQDIDISNPLNETPQEYTIEEVEVRGNEFTRTEFIRNASGLTENSSIIYPGSDITEAVKRLYRSGLFADIMIFVKEKRGESISFIIEVVEQPRIFDYELLNIKRSQRRDLEDLIRLQPGTALTDVAIGQATNTIKRFYREKGFWNTEVSIDTSVVTEQTNRVRVFFDINAGEKLEVKDIFFEGNQAYSDKKLTKQMKPLKEDAWWKIFGKKLYKQEDFEEGKASVLSFYRKNGYADARILSDSVFTFSYDGDKTGIKVKVSVEEGPQYKIRNVNWDGNTVYTDETLSDVLDFQKGDIYNEEKFQEKFQFSQRGVDINSLYTNVGYLFVSINPTLQKIGEDSLDVYVEIIEDEIATIDNVDFSGNTRTHDDVVRRTLRTIPGATYSQDAVIRSIRELGTLGYFDQSTISPDLNPNIQDKTVDIVYNLDDTKSTSNFEFSGGYGGSAIGVILSARINFNNFSIQRAFEKGGWNPIPSGDGQRLTLGVQVTGTGYQSYNLGFNEPWFRGKPTSLGFNFSYDFINFRNSNEKNELFSASVQLGKRLKWPDDYFQMQTSIGYQLYDVVGNRTLFNEGTSSLLTIKQVFERNSLDNFISPNNGSKFTFSIDLSPPLPGFAEFYKFKTAFQHHVPLVDKLVLTSTVDYGYIGYFTENKRSDLQRFLLGGTQLQQRQSFLYDNIDMRGYPGGIRESIAPIVDGRQVGGRIYNKYSLELRYPAVTSEQIQVIPYTFIDAGNVFLDFDEFDPFSVKRSAGFGARLYLPILGLIDLSYGYRLDGIRGTSVRPGDWEFLFNIGAPF